MAWTNGSGTPKRVGVGDFVKTPDFTEIATAINRRRLLIYRFQRDWSDYFPPTAADWVRYGPISSMSSPPADALRKEIVSNLIGAPTGGLGGDPAGPQALDWLDGDGDLIVTGTPGEDEVNLFSLINGGSNWTDPSLSTGTFCRAVHLNELRKAMEVLRHGRWKLPIYFCMGIFSLMPDYNWIGEIIGHNDEGDECRSIGYSVFITDDEPPRGLSEVAARSSSYIELTADTDCTVAVYHGIRTLEPYYDPPTWNEYQDGSSWASPGALGSGDSRSIGSVSLTADEPGTVGGAALAAELTKIVDGEPPYFLIRRSDTGPETIKITGSLVIEFDLDVPPN